MITFCYRANAVIIQPASPLGEIWVCCFHLTFVLGISTSESLCQHCTEHYFTTLSYFTLLGRGEWGQGICLCSPFSKMSFPTFCSLAVWYLRLERPAKGEKWTGRLPYNESFWKEKRQLKRKTVDFRLAGLTLQRCLTLRVLGEVNYTDQNTLLRRVRELAQERERERKGARGRKFN